MAYDLVPFELEDGTKSDVVFFLSNDGSSLLVRFTEECRDKLAALKLAKAIESVHTIGVDASRHGRRLKKLKGQSANDLYEVVTNKCTARAYAFLIEGEMILVIADIAPKTHSGAGKKEVSGAIARLQNKRADLEEALKRRYGHGKEV